MFPGMDFDLARAGKGKSHGWFFFSCYNSEQAHTLLKVVLVFFCPVGCRTALILQITDLLRIFLTDAQQTSFILAALLSHANAGHLQVSTGLQLLDIGGRVGGQLRHVCRVLLQGLGRLLVGISQLVLGLNLAHRQLSAQVGQLLL